MNLLTPTSALIVLAAGAAAPLCSAESSDAKPLISITKSTSSVLLSSQVQDGNAPDPAGGNTPTIELNLTGLPAELRQGVIDNLTGGEEHDITRRRLYLIEPDDAALGFDSESTRAEIAKTLPADLPEELRNRLIEAITRGTDALTEPDQVTVVESHGNDYASSPIKIETVPLADLPDGIRQLVEKTRTSKPVVVSKKVSFTGPDGKTKTVDLLNPDTTPRAETSGLEAKLDLILNRLDTLETNVAQLQGSDGSGR